MLADLIRLAIMSSKGRADPSGNIARRPSRDYSHTPLNEVTLIPFRHRRSASFGYTSIRMNPNGAPKPQRGAASGPGFAPPYFAKLRINATTSALSSSLSESPYGAISADLPTAGPPFLMTSGALPVAGDMLCRPGFRPKWPIPVSRRQRTSVAVRQNTSFARLRIPPRELRFEEI